MLQDLCQIFNHSVSLNTFIHLLELLYLTHVCESFLLQGCKRIPLPLIDMRSSFLAGEITRSLESSMGEGETYIFLVFSTGIYSKNGIFPSRSSSSIKDKDLHMQW